MNSNDLPASSRAATSAVRAILDNYQGENAGVLTNLARLLSHGRLGGTGKLVILPVDQGFEHGPDRSFAPNPVGYDPISHFELAINAECNAYAAPLGFLKAGAARYAGQIPLILKVNNSDSLSKIEPCSAVTSWVDDALQLGCCAVGYTIYPGSSARNLLLETARKLIRAAQDVGLPTVIWSYPRGSGIDEASEQRMDVVAYAAHEAAQLGAHIIKVKLPNAQFGIPKAKKVYEETQIPVEQLADRVKHIVRCAFNSKRIVIFSGGEAKDDESLLTEIRAIHEGGGFGSIIGRNAFQRSAKDAIKLFGEIMTIYEG